MKKNIIMGRIIFKFYKSYKTNSKLIKPISSFLLIFFASIIYQKIESSSQTETNFVASTFRVGYGIFSLKSDYETKFAALPIDSRNSLAIRIFNTDLYDHEVLRSCSKVDDIFYRKIILKKIERSPLTYRIALGLRDSDDAINCLKLIINMVLKQETETLKLLSINPNATEIKNKFKSNIDIENSNFFNNTISILTRHHYALLDEYSVFSEKVDDTISLIEPEIIEFPHKANFTAEFNQSTEFYRYIFVVVVFGLVIFLTRLLSE